MTVLAMLLMLATTVVKNGVHEAAHEVGVADGMAKFRNRSFVFASTPTQFIFSPTGYFSGHTGLCSFMSSLNSSAMLEER